MSKMPNLRIFFICFFVALGPAIFGLETSELAGFQAMKSFVRDFGAFNPTTKGYVLPAAVQTLLSAFFNSGAMIGSILSGPIGRQWGRRWGLAITGVTVILGVVIQTVSTSNAVLYFGRAIAGMGVGGISNFVPMYQAEVAPAKLRGLLMASYQFFTGLGQLLGSCINNGTHNIQDRMAYRIPLMTQLFFPILLTLGVFFLPESPRWLLGKDRTEKALEAIQRVRPKGTPETDLIAELANEKLFIKVEDDRPKIGQFLECFKGTNLPRTHVACGVMIWSILSGISFINGYGTYFFTVTGVKNSFMTQIIMTSCALAGLFTNFAIVRYVGRRPMLVWGGLFQGIAMITFAIVGTILPATNQLTGKVLVTCICVYGFCYNMTWGPVGWMVLPEVVSNNMRSPTVAIATCCHWAANLLVTCGVPYLINPQAANLGVKTGYVFSAMNFVAFVWCWIFLPETKDRTLEEVDEMYIKKVPIRKFASFKCTGSVEGVDSKEVQFVDADEGRDVEKNITSAHVENLADVK